ncbi:hypothetical protein [Caballeronia sp. LZ032]|uniref:hypothetical protein n=1 Tax=Caballeronia sp. LZ032 TaxID=3038565 RepID=UPI0028671D8C|nr:hypothetical protein [Caballeronia sp. LZ032]MDR5878801.1 hypothetical protein [Caballeronia sp. LZ032]
MNAENWQNARIQWESEPTASYAQVADSFGVSKALVGRKAKEQGWQKRLSADVAADRAHEIAASEFTHSAIGQPGQAPVVDANRSGIRPGLPTVSSGVPVDQARAAAAASAVGRRAEVEIRHGQEHAAARSLLYGAMKSRDFESTKQAKLALESLKILHDLERRAWRLDASPANALPAVSITINRRSRAKDNT